MPYLDALAFARHLEATQGGSARLSVFALGLAPFISALTGLELLKLAVPRFAAWIAREPKAYRAAMLVVAAFALVSAAMQGTGISVALAAMGLVAEDTLSQVAVTVTLLAGVAVLILVSQSIRLQRLPIGGVWLVIALPAAGSIVAEFGQLLELLRIGAVDTPLVAAAFALSLSAITAIVFLATALEKCVRAAGGDPFHWTPILVWPPLIAGSIANFIVSLVFEFMPIAPTLSFFDHDTLWSLAFSLLVPIIVYLYARAITRSVPGAATWFGKRSVLTFVSLAQISICVGPFLASNLLSPLPINSTLIVIVVAFWAISRQFLAPRAHLIGQS
ncbi:hypothetical protein J6595_10555 [Jiella sp. KSK16Y-1]|uniref:Preprotein translocase subunit SecY n=1 Tax=Jiella mangrovi TaxID=2821407 RepID=A0ABS4BJ28_9HYPH|nr:hypothetical protein [Jiella mangrovi]